MSLVSKAPSKKYDDFFKRSFGEAAPVQKGKFRYDSEKHATVPIEENAINVPGPFQTFHFPDLVKGL